MTRTRQFKRGDILFSEGDPVEGVLSVRSGSIEVLRRRNGAEFVLGTVHGGHFLGEMSVADNRSHRSATARAVSDGEIEFIGRTEFLDQISRSPDAARSLIARLCHRLHDLEDRVVTDEQRLQPREGRGGLGDSLAMHDIILAAETADLRRQLSEPFDIGTVPFVVGRAVLSGEPSASRELNLKLQDHVPLRLSRNHFAIVRRDGHFYVRDLRSTLGTTVNGWPIGEHFGSDEAPLTIGENEVIAGGKGSPFVFLVIVAGENTDDSEGGSLPNDRE